MIQYQYYCKECGYKRETLLDHPAIGIGSYSCICPECNGDYDSYEIPTACACLGPIGNDPYCPCTMKAKGLTPTELWTEEKKQELNNVLAKVFGWDAI